MNRRAALAALALLALAPACERPDPEREAILAACDRRAEALRRLDPALYEPLVSANYRSGETGRDAIVARFRRLAKDNDPVRYEILERRVEMKGSLAEVYERYRLTFQGPKGPRTAEDTSRLVLAREEGGWRFVSGL